MLRHVFWFDVGVTGRRPVVYDNADMWNFCREHQEEAVWHLFLWAVMSNDREIAELFLSKTSCKIGKYAGIVVTYVVAFG